MMTCKLSLEKLPLYTIMLLSNRKEIVALIELRDTLLSKLMSGEFDVSSVEL